jgi:hypothetical protein
MQWLAFRWDRKAAEIISGQPLFAVFAVFYRKFTADSSSSPQESWDLAGEVDKRTAE